MTDATNTAPKPSILSLFKTDRASEEEGRWFPLGGPIQVQLRRFTSKKSAAVRDELYRPYKRPGKVDMKVPTEVDVDLTNQHLARGVIVNWKGLYAEDGSEIPFSADEAYKLLTELPDFAREIVMLAIDMDNYRAQTDAAIAKN